MVDKYGGSFSTGYACFGDRLHAETFETISEAKEWITKHIEEFKLTTRSLNYNLSTLAIRKCIYKTEEKIKLY